LSAFLDTSGLYAALVRNEPAHDRVAQGLTKLWEDGRTLWATSYVVLETVALLQRRLGLSAVQDFAERLAPTISVVWVSEALHQRGLRRLFRENRRNLSLVDCVSFEFMESLGLREALALDQQFAEAGYRLIP